MAKDNTKLTPEQQQAVTEKGMVMVSASAGSGKTHTMLERIMHLISSGVSLTRMLILVYNEANASELREKIRQKLFEKVCETVGEEGDKYRRQLDEISFATIGTIHAFCRGIIRKNFELLGVNPDFDILDTPAEESYMNKALDQVFNDYGDKGDEVFVDMLSIFEVTRSEDNLRSNIIKLYRCMDVQSNLDEFIEKVKSYYVDESKFDDVIFGKYSKVMKEVKVSAQEVLPVLVETSQPAYIDRMNDVITIADLVEERNIPALLSGMDFFAARLSVKRKTMEPKSIEKAKKCNEVAKDIVKEISSLYGDYDYKKAVFEQNKIFATKLLELTLSFKSTLEGMKEKDNVMTFSDLEHFAVKLIDQGVNVAEEYDYVFVDEYQDVNRAQEYVISGIIKDQAFMVGDVKQSIYGFRLADPDIFLARQQRYITEESQGGDSHPIFFNDNFRSDNQILQFVNGIFERAMTIESAGVDYKGKAKFNNVSSPDRNEGRVEIHVFNENENLSFLGKELYSLSSHSDAEKLEKGVVSEGRYIAQEIKRLKGRTMLTIKDQLRPLEYGDFAILFRKRGAQSNLIIEEIKKAGIPVDEGSFKSDDTPAEKELISMLSVIDNPHQDFHLAGYMLSYLGGYTENELAHIVECAEDVETDLYDKVLLCSQKDDTLGRKLKETLASLDKYRVKVSIQSVKEFVEDLTHETCLDGYLASRGQSYLNGLESFIKSIREDSSLSKFLRDYKETGRDDKGRPVGGDKVHVSTYHGYKGLETPVVFLPNSSNTRKGGPVGTKDMTVDANGCIAMSHFDVDGKVKNSATISNKAAQILLEDKEYKEEMRLLYVALTRAQKYMYITGTVKCDDDDYDIDSIQEMFAVENFEREKCLFNYVFTAIKQGCLSAVPYLHVATKRPIDSEADKPIFAKIEEDSPFAKELCKQIEKRREFVYPYTEEAGLSMKYTVTQINSEEMKDVTPAMPTFDEDETRPSVATIGTAYHKVMELIDFSIDNLSDVTKAIDLMVSEGNLTSEQRCLVKDEEILLALMNPVIKSAVGIPCRHEQPFMIYVPAKEVIDGSKAEDKVLVQGVIDLLIFGEKKMIVDYKYSAFRTQKSKDKYKKQLYLYKLAYERAFREKIDKVVLLSLKTGESFEL